MINQNAEKIAVILILFSYSLYFLFALSTANIFSQSDYFTIGPSLSILGQEIEASNTQWAGWCIFFFLNSVIAQSNSLIISPIFQRIIFGGLKPEYPKNTMLLMLFVYDVWIGIYMFISIIGVFSNILFLISTVTGYILADIIWKYIYITNPNLLRHI